MNMVIRAKNPNQNIKPVSFTHVQTTTETQATTESTNASDINEIYDTKAKHDFKAIKAETTLSRPGFHFLSQSIANLIDEKATQTQKALELKTQMQNATPASLSQDLQNQWQNLQPEMAQTRKKLQKLQSKEKWLQAGIIDQKQVQVGKKWIDNAEHLAQMSPGAPKNVAALTNHIEMMQHTPGLNPQSMRLSIAEAGALNRHQLGDWLSSTLPSHVLAQSVLNILTQSTPAPAANSKTEQWLDQGYGGANLSRFKILSQTTTLDQEP
jgi:hypothetical protein